MDVSETEAAVLAAIVGADTAWLPADAFDRGDVANLDLGGWVTIWERTDYDAITLTPWGAAMLGVVIGERWEFTVATEQEVGRRGRLRTVTHREATETPVWRDAKYDDDGVLIREADLETPRWMRTARIPNPGQIPAPPPPEELVDADGDYVEIWGRRVKIDNRLRKGIGSTPATR